MNSTMAVLFLLGQYFEVNIFIFLWVPLYFVTNIYVTTICIFLGAGGEDTGLKNAPGTGWDLQGRIYSVFMI